MKNFDDIKKDASMLLTQSYLRKGGMYQNQLQFQQQVEIENRIQREQQIKIIEEKEDIQLDASRPIQANDELNQLIYGFKNSDSADKNSGMNNLFQNRKFQKSYSIISQKQQTHQDTLTNLQINGDLSIKSQSPFPTLDLEFEKKKVLTELYVADSDENQIETYGSLDNHMNMLEKSKPVNGACSVQTAYFNKNKNSISFNNPSSYFPTCNKNENQINQVSRFGLNLANNHMASSEFDQYSDNYETDFQERGEETIRKTQITNYQFQTLQPHLSQKREQIFNPQGKKMSNNASFSNNINQTTTSNRIASSDALNSSKRVQNVQRMNQNVLSNNQSKEFSVDLTSSHPKQNKDQQSSQQLAHYSFMQSHNIQDSSHNSTSDIHLINNNHYHSFNQQTNNIENYNILNNQQDFLIILSDNSIESFSPEPALNRELEKKKGLNSEQFVADSDENLLETYGSLDNNISMLEKTINGSIQTAYQKNKNQINFPIKQEQNVYQAIPRFAINQQSNLITSQELEESVDKARITNYQFQVLQPHLSQKREQIFNPQSKKNISSNNTSFSNNINTTTSNNKIISPKNDNCAKRVLTSPNQNQNKYNQTKEYVDNLISQQTKQNNIIQNNLKNNNNSNNNNNNKMSNNNNNKISNCNNNNNNNNNNNININQNQIQQKQQQNIQPHNSQMQSQVGIHDTSHNSTSDLFSQQQQIDNVMILNSK